MDVLRLSRAMTYKSAVAGLNLGGGKALIMADPRTDKNEAMLRAFGRHVDSLGGRYVTTEDVGMTPRDLEHIAEETEHVVGLPESLGGSGDTSVMTGLGVYLGMKAAAKATWGDDGLSGRTVAIPGLRERRVEHGEASHRGGREDRRDRPVRGRSTARGGHGGNRRGAGRHLRRRVRYFFALRFGRSAER